jgi:hypothetical protein
MLSLPSRAGFAEDFCMSADQEFAGEQVETRGVDAFRRLLFMCLPPKIYGQVRLGLATQRKFIATVWVVSPEVFEGKTQIEMAAMLRMSRRGFIKACDEVRAAIENRKKK